MGILALAADERVADVIVAEDVISVRVKDGRIISVPIVWYPRLLKATEAERKNWTIIGGGYGIHWPDIDEDLSTEGLLRGGPAPPLHNVTKIKADASQKIDDQTIPEVGISDKGIWDYVPETETASTKIVDLLALINGDIESLTGKVEDHSEKIAKITKPGASARQFRGVTLMLAGDLNAFSAQLEKVLPGVNEATQSLESNFIHVVDFIDPTDQESGEAISSLRSQLIDLLSSVRGVKDSIASFRGVMLQLQQNNLSAELNKACGRLLAGIDAFLASYEEMESFGLKIAFRLDEKFGP